ncbi:MAG TPA: protein-disulfide reductase DsbD domain-containing protein [Verrucomicrobiae bacterium]|jgi:thiol:disulfide interchange protein DsbD
MQQARGVQVLLALAALALSPGFSLAASKTETRLVLSLEAARPGDTVFAGVHLRMAPRWHTYWRNGGDSGAATRIEWTLPTGVTAGEILWPVPEKFEQAGLTTYVYHNEVVLLVPLSVGPGAAAGPMELKAKVSWLECEELCLPGNAQLSAALTVGAETRPSKDAVLIETWQKKLPQPKPSADVRAWWETATTNDSRPLLVEWTKDAATKDADFYGFESDKFVVKPATEQLTADAGKVRLRKVVEKLSGWPERLSGLLIEKPVAGEPVAAYQVSVPITGDKSVAASDWPPEEKKPLIVWLGIAFLGGLILNLMPCVLPVLALKVLSFVNQSTQEAAQTRKLSLIYALGVVVSFLVMAGLVIAGSLKAWGQQYGSPVFLIGVITLMTLIALSLFGVFEITMSGAVMNAAGDLASREGAKGAFFNGAVATILGTSCTAPLLAPAIGFAFFQPPLVIILIFLMIGLGLAAPYVALCFVPGLSRFIPKPGAWMERFKVAMGFPMLATAVWLMSILTRHYGGRGVLWVGFFLICVSIAAWIWGEFVQRGRSRKALAVGFVLCFVATGYLVALEGQLQWRRKATSDQGGPTIPVDRDGIAWQPWSREAVEKAQGEGRPVLVDFTADWCPNCQVNKKTSLEIDSVRAKLKEINAVSLLADYTLVPEDITAELKRFNRAAVPLVLVYPKNAKEPPQVLPPLLTPGIVLEALEKAAK